MTYDFDVSAVIPATPPQVYAAWLSSSGHAAMTGAGAAVDGTVGGDFEAWDGYITGSTLELDPGRRIVQSWRTSEFPADAADSTIEVTLEPAGAGTLVTIHHSGVPRDQCSYEEGGWQENYFDPMAEYFSG
jgi:uncharacterized protein YndB with AHSA1/START domain